jgi:23S rRNA (cytosine1962-C5)-methyltransferase
MKELILSKSGAQKIRNFSPFLSVSDIEDSINSTTPGQWVYFINSKTNQKYLGFVNKLCQDKNMAVSVCSEVSSSIESIEEFIEEKIQTAFEFRTKLFKESARLFFGKSDELPGLIVDEYENIVLIQINSSGMDHYRELIKKVYNNLTNKESFLLDNKSYRAKEGLPEYEPEILPDMIDIKENGLKYSLNSKSLQKVGYYYDHRVNRNKLYSWIKKQDLENSKGIDLFSYIGSWGMHLLKAGVKSVDFVDQGDFESDINKNFKLNDFDGKVEFFRSDVFKFLDKSILEDKKYDYICCDPPAFTKSKKNKMNALVGYEKLHSKVFKIASKGSFVAFGSCTKYIDLLEFQKTITQSALKESRKISLIDVGSQAPDHRNSGLTDMSNYIKFLLYYVE